MTAKINQKRRAPDNSLAAKVAESSLVAIVSRIAVVVLTAIAGMVLYIAKDYTDDQQDTIMAIQQTQAGQQRVAEELLGAVTDLTREVDLIRFKSSANERDILRQRDRIDGLENRERRDRTEVLP